MAKITFYPGNGHEYEIEVDHITADYPRGEDGTCAFCHADPCDEKKDVNTFIHQFYVDSKEEGYNPLTCPMCDGRPT
jgi:hypothetical protein